MSVEQERDVTDAGGFDVSDKMYQISEATNSDGTVDVTIYDYEESGDEDEVVVKFKTPTLKKKTEVMEWPDKDSAEYKFVRVCRKTVGDLNAAKFLKTDGAEITANPDNWEIDATLPMWSRYKIRENTNTLKDGLITAFNAMVILSPIFLIVYGFGTGIAFPAIPVGPLEYLMLFILNVFIAVCYADVLFHEED